MTIKIIYFLLPFFCFIVPISTFGSTVCLLAIILLWLVTADYQKKMRVFWQEPITRVFLIGVLLSLGSLFYTEANTKEALDGLKDSLRLGSIGIFIYYFKFYASETLKKRCIQAFIFAMLITAVLGYLKYFFHLLPHKKGLTEAAVFKNHIKTSFFMTMAVYFMGHYLRAQPKNILLWIGIFFMSGYVLFLSEGRMGYIIFGVLALYYFWDMAKIRGMIGIASVLISVIVLSQCFSLKLYERMAYLPKDLTMFLVNQQVATSSLGSRLSFIDVSTRLIQEKSWFGWGVGGFRQAYKSRVPQENLQTDNPHNEFLRIGVEFGALGLAWFMYLIFTVHKKINQLPKGQQFLMRGIGLAFLIGCLANSWLMDFSEGMFIVVMLSLFLGKIHADNAINHCDHVQLASST